MGLLGVHLESGLVGIPVIFALAALAAVFFSATGTYFALRVGTAEAVEGIFPIFFVMMFLSSSNFPRDLIDVRWFRIVATINPLSYVIEGIRSLITTGWEGTILLRGFAVAIALCAAAIGTAASATRTRLKKV